MKFLLDVPPICLAEKTITIAPHITIKNKYKLEVIIITTIDMNWKKHMSREGRD